MCRYGTVMGGLLSEKFLDTNLAIPFAGPPLNSPSLQIYKRVHPSWIVFFCCLRLIQPMLLELSFHLNYPCQALNAWTWVWTLWSLILDQKKKEKAKFSVNGNVLLTVCTHVKHSLCIRILIVNMLKEERTNRCMWTSSTQKGTPSPSWQVRVRCMHNYTSLLRVSPDPCQQ